MRKLKKIFKIALFLSVFLPVCSLSALPDLVVNTVSCPDSSYARGANMSVWSTIQNTGDTAAIYNSYKVGFYLAITTTTAMSAATYLNSADGLALNASVSGTVYPDLRVPAGIALGNYYIGVNVDPSNQLMESNENNNIRWSVNTIAITDSVQINTSTAATQPESIENAYCYPVPAHLSLGHSVRFSKLTPNAKVVILTVAGHKIWETTADATGTVQVWNGKTAEGDKVGSGTYIVHITDDSSGKSKILKIMVIK